MVHKLSIYLQELKNIILTPTNAMQSCCAHAYPAGARQGKKHVDLVIFGMQKITGHRKRLCSHCHKHNNNNTNLPQSFIQH
jgi:hypothetical protein